MIWYQDLSYIRELEHVMLELLIHIQAVWRSVYFWVTIVHIFIYFWQSGQITISIDRRQTCSQENFHFSYAICKNTSNRQHV